MTVAVMAPPVGFAVAALKGSVRIDVVGGRKRYVAVDRVGRAVIGPLAKRRKKMFAKTPTTAVAGSRLMTGEEMAKAQSLQGVADSLRQAFQPPSQPTPPQEPKKPSVWQRVKDKALGVKDTVLWRLYDHEWHKAVQHTAADVIVWALAIGVVSFIVKAVLWTWL